MSKPSKSRKKKNKDSILHRDIKDLHILRSLKRLGQMRVTEWELKDLPNLRVTDWELKDLPNLRVTDWELSDIINYRVTEWELSDLLGRRQRGKAVAPPSAREMDRLGDSLASFIRFTSKNLIDETNQAEITITKTSASSLMIKLILSRRDAAAIIGHGGHTAAAIRNIVKETARSKGARAYFRILTREEENP